MDNELKHVGVLGMRWGVRRGSSGGSSGEARRNREAGVLEARKRTGLSTSKHKNVKKMSDKELDRELSTLSLHDALMNGKKLNRVNKVGKRKMSDLDKKQTKEELKKVAKVVGIGLAAYGAFHVADMMAGRYLQKYYAKEIGNTLINSLRGP